MDAKRNHGGGMLHNVFTVLSGSVVAQLIAVAVLPVLTRLYDAEAFGKYQIYVSSLNVLMMIVAFRYEVAMLNAEPGREFDNLIKLILRLILATSFVCLIVIILIGESLASYRSELTYIAYLLGPAMLVGGLHQMLIYLPIRNRDYHLSAVSKVIQSTGFAVCGIASSVPALSSVGLILADISARVMAGIWILKRTRGIGSTLLRAQSRGDFLETAQVFRKFPLLTFPGTLLSALAAVGGSPDFSRALRYCSCRPVCARGSVHPSSGRCSGCCDLAGVHW